MKTLFFLLILSVNIFGSTDPMKDICKWNYGDDIFNEYLATTNQKAKEKLIKKYKEYRKTHRAADGPRLLAELNRYTIKGLKNE